MAGGLSGQARGLVAAASAISTTAIAATVGVAVAAEAEPHADAALAPARAEEPHKGNEAGNEEEDPMLLGKSKDRLAETALNLLDPAHR